jgi:asparagine synthase (glutamine-hydrolysing)
MMYLDLRITLADSDIRKVSRMCEIAGLRVRYPMLDDDLVAFSATVPPEFHTADGTLRAFYKKAVAGLLPSEILAKKKKGFGLPYMELLTGHRPLAELACDSLQSLKARGYFQSRFLDEVTDDLNAGRLGRFDGIAWDLMMLEKWFETRMTSSAIR